MAEIDVEVCYATPKQVFLKPLRLPAGADVKTAIEQSGVLEEAPEIDLTTCRVGVYGKSRTLDAPLRERDRVEIYRPLIADPMEARRRRAARKER